MNIYLTSLLIYAIPANLIAGIIMYAGRKNAQWRPVEYAFIYLPWLLAVSLIVFIFGSLDAAVAKTDISPGLFRFFSIAGGMLGAVALLPRIYFIKLREHWLVGTSIISFLAAITFVKLIMLIFMFMPSSVAVQG